MTESNTLDKALDHASVAPGEPQSTEQNPAHHPDQNAGQDESIAERLEADPEDVEARLDAGLDQSMDASDPPSSTQPVHSTEPAPSSGFDEKAEEALRSR